MTATVTKLSESDDLPEERTPTGWYRFWQKEMEASHKRMRRFRKQGNSVVDRYLDKRNGGGDDSWFAGAFGVSTPTSRLNLFHTNITTTAAMLYGNIPRVDVSREHADPDDDVARVAAMLYQRILQSDVEASGEGFPTTLKAALMDRLLPGLGVARLRYELETSTTVTLNPETLEPQETEQIVREGAPCEYVHWQDFAYGWGRTWAELPWLGFRSWLSKAEAKKRFGDKVAEALSYQTQQPTGAESDKDDVMNVDQENNVQKAAVWEIWQKSDRRVYWWSDEADIILDSAEDTLGLDGFWPCPMPMAANLTTSLYLPQADFITGQDLYNEIDILQSRITNITRAIKVVGVYDKSATDSVGRMLKEGVENDMIPVDNWAMFAEKGALKGTIDWFPVEMVVSTLKVLGEIQTNKVAQLNDLTGMSEIMKGGAGGQYTAASSNQMAAKMGSIRVQALQEDFARFASDLEGIKAEIISKHFAEPSIMRQSNAQFIPEADKDKVPSAVQLMKSPDIKWRVDIRPESIAMVDYAQLKQERTEFLTAMATYIQSAQAAAKAMPGALPVLLELLKWGMAGFKGAQYLEGTMDAAIDAAKKAPPQDEGGGAEKAKAEAEMQKIQAASQADMQKIQAKSQADMQLQQTKAQNEMQKQQSDFQMKLQEQQAQSQADQKRIMTDLQADLAVIAAKLNSDLSVEEAQSTFAIAEEEVQHSNTLDAIDAQPTPTGGSDNG